MMLTLILSSFVVELAVYLFWKTSLRTALAWLSQLLNVCVAGALITQPRDFWVAVSFVVVLWRTVNILRIIVHRHDAARLRRMTMRSSLWFGSAQILGGVLLCVPRDVVAIDVLVSGWISLQIIVAVGLWAITLRNVTKSRFRPEETYYADRDLPSVSVCIAARNETASLEDCLRSMLASDYPKLEVIVLDDSSHDNTPDVIRGFAHDGVRFVQGSEPDEHWLAKNLAYQRLSEEASGEIVLFCGVDVRFQRESLRRMITALQLRKKDMLCVLPQRFHDSVAGAFIQPMRYWWELALPRRLFNRPPVLSTCWLIRKATLRKTGGFASYGRSIIPEQHFARFCAEYDGYSFIRSDAYLGVQTEKTVSAQRATVIRTRYPQIHQRLEIAALLITTEVMFMIGPFITLMIGVGSANAPIIYTSVLAATFLVATHVQITYISSPPSVPISLINYPIAVIAELALSIVSLIRYEFYTVVWKGRVIVPRKLQVISQLPPLSHDPKTTP